MTGFEKLALGATIGTVALSAVTSILGDWCYVWTEDAVGALGTDNEFMFEPETYDAMSTAFNDMSASTKVIAIATGLASAGIFGINRLSNSGARS